MMIITYNKEEHETLWDKFVEKDSVNGTFLHSRRFLNYHGEKYKDYSIIIGNNLTDIWAIVPACLKKEDGKKVFVSHAGSTYGGLVVSKIRYNLMDMLSIIELLDGYLKENFDKVIFKLTPDIFCCESTELHQYLLSYFGFSNYTEFSTFIDYKTYGDDALLHMNNARRRKIKKCFASDLKFRRINANEEIALFYDLLIKNLEKHGVKPVHSLAELLDFKNKRLKDEVSFYGVYLQETMIAGAMSFYFDKTKTFHIQYSAADQKLEKLTPMSFLFYSLIMHGIEQKYNKLSWGISTEKQGSVLNLQLAQTKESYGSKFILNRTFFKEYT